MELSEKTELAEFTSIVCEKDFKLRKKKTENRIRKYFKGLMFNGLRTNHAKTKAKVENLISKNECFLRSLAQIYAQQNY